MASLCMELMTDALPKHGRREAEMQAMAGTIEIEEEGDREREFLALFERFCERQDSWVLHSLVHLIPCACCVHCGGVVLCANCAFVELVGWPGSEGRHLDELVPRDHLPHVWARLEAHEPGAYDVVARTAAGWQLVNVAPVGIGGWDGCDGARLILVHPLAHLTGVEWVTGGGIAPTGERG